MSTLSSRQQILLFLGLTIAWAIWTLVSTFNDPHLDISALFMAGWLVGSGQEELIYLAPPNVYEVDQMPIWRETMIAQGLPEQVVTAYIYPPIWAKLLAWPAHAMPAIVFFKSVFIWHMLAVLATVPLAFTLIRRAARPELTAWGITLFAILFATWPVINAFLTNQPQITVTLLIVASAWLVSRDRDIAGGTLLGLAAAIKVAPILFALIFVINRNWRALFATLAVSGSIALLSIAIMGWPLHAAFLDRLSQINGLIVMNKINYSPEALIYQFADWLKGVPMVDGRERASFTADEPVWITLVTKAGFLASLAAFWACTRDLPREDRLPVQLFLLCLITALFGPLSWAHYFFMPALLLPALFLVMPAPRAWKWIATVIIISSLAAFSLLHRFNHIFMFSALVPMLMYLALTIDTLRAARQTARAAVPTN
ncbi:glycosyltransferase family 87 protein [Marimonas arenosa]|uniref:DUF2029 domain-containing protein n=1 Tax=Marimonas arenosa TaxID=1795305 RepID=A0AAE3WBX4_9RHOB|nr:glycosyltransferase family 87 protein [Marimonas arenosa]MDQ2090116.1 DUF2029 domain-containing protein [Marimonas arenosa]